MRACRSSHIITGLPNRFDGVTGATYSSKGAAAGVNAALTAVSEYLAQGGQTQ